MKTKQRNNKIKIMTIATLFAILAGIGIVYAFNPNACNQGHAGEHNPHCNTSSSSSTSTTSSSSTTTIRQCSYEGFGGGGYGEHNPHCTSSSSSTSTTSSSSSTTTIFQCEDDCGTTTSSTSITTTIPAATTIPQHHRNNGASPPCPVCAQEFARQFGGSQTIRYLDRGIIKILYPNGTIATDWPATLDWILGR